MRSSITLMLAVMLAAGCSDSSDGDRGVSPPGAYSAVVAFLVAEGLGDRPVVYVLDRTDLQVGTFFCDPVDEFGENPKVCAELTLVDEATPFPREVREAIEDALAAITQVEFVDDVEDVTVPAPGIELTRVIDDGGLVRFGPTVGSGSTVHLAVECRGCRAGAVWLLRLNQAGDTWDVEDEIVAIW